MIKQIVKRTFRTFGLDLQRYDRTLHGPTRLASMLAWHHVDLVLDVGANTGQFGSELREAGYRGRIVSFEPLTSARARLVDQANGDSLWEVAPRAAIGAEDGEIDIHISGNSVSSSVLDTTDALLKQAPECAYVGTERVPLSRLDTIAAPFLHGDSKLLIKIDTQGYERDVLKGAAELLKQAVGIHIELSFVPLYRDQALFDEMFGQLEALGFEVWDIGPVLFEPQSCRLVQADGIFFRNLAPPELHPESIVIAGTSEAGA